MTNELIPLENVNALEVFSTDGGLDPIIEKIKTEVKNEVFDISTPEGRARIASMAKKIGSAKVKLDDMGKQLTEDWRNKTNAVNSERNRMRNELETLRDEVKAPLDEYRNREKKRIENHEASLEKLAQYKNYVMGDEFGKPSTAELLDMKRKESQQFHAGREWEEFTDRANAQQETNEAVLTTAYENKIKEDAEQEELERLRAEKVQREKEEHEAKIKAEAAEKARIEAEQKAQREAAEAKAKAQAEQERVEREKREAEDRANKAEQDRIDAENKAKADAKAAAEKAEADKQAAIDKERADNAAKAKAEADELAKREADKKHRSDIDNAAIQSLVDAGMLKDHATAAVTLIATGKIPHVKIEY